MGHACGHNIIGTTSVAAGIALSQTLSETGGKVVVLGTPAEEGGPNGSAKGSFVKHGYLKDVDVALMIHPAGQTSLTSETLAVDPLDFHFYGKAAHASGSPEKGINALDAVIQLFVGINALRQQLPDDVRIHGIITNGEMHLISFRNMRLHDSTFEQKHGIKQKRLLQKFVRLLKELPLQLEQLLKWKDSKMK